ncbi:YIEGIA family protein [Microaerobacter geothermalis]|uniref:YIEGIA family protein n=1 Tax=Microaerobacter geothermalis TaxID=674972 RepID=UPI001F2790C3|nr:YIEGIA family protein [Microaerobacter geothermalis]MCF6092437.1 YIEGIA family protein [Microaerobacter geothermalis]
MKPEGMLDHESLVLILTAIIMGTLARWLTIKEDYRQYPTYPNGYLIHLVTGFIASALGAVAIPALLTKNFVAVTFLTLAIQQFRDVRKMEKESLKDLESTEYTFRGDAYIDGIAKTFESRNYFSLLVSLGTAISMQLTTSEEDWINISVGVVTGLLLVYILKRFSKGKTVGDIADVEEGKVEVKGTELYVNGVFVSNLLGTDNAQEMFKKEGMAVVINPREDHFRIALDHFGQRQAILFEATKALGVKRYHFSRKEYEQGRIIITLVPIKKDIDALIEVVKKSPLLETIKKSHRVMKTNLFGGK